jgi:hypothetical protein
MVVGMFAARGTSSGWILSPFRVTSGTIDLDLSWILTSGQILNT